ncbi:hypothetical protein QF034_007288 [Streptomyces africanus]|uniref:Uncharacterized protein n=1 Tax=Streptomyces africanus TaxID=231024 RepID=A0ABU0R383_9ACTN|nr:hypothetical protein [Streptomyces africanus]MDQ0753057.1 hypothetical protein [Streptomyces africanus]
MCGEQDARYGDDTKVLAAIGTHVATQTDRVTVRLPRALAEAAVAAWEREENDAPAEETPERYALRDRAAELALIGLAITERGRWEGEEVAVDLDLASAGAAVRAAQ